MTNSCDVSIRLSAHLRAQVVEAAMLWLRTPYHHNAAVKGVAADCAMFPLKVYRECGLVPADYVPPQYSSQWHLHRADEKYLMEIEKLGVEKAPYQLEPADFVIFKFGRTFSHGAIVVNWPHVIHAYIPHGVTLTDAARDAQLIGRDMKAFEIAPPSGVPLQACTDTKLVQIR